MRLLLLAMLLLMVGLAPLPVRALESTPFVTARDTATLVSEQDSVAEGAPIRLAIRFKLAPGWHTYWSNPGDAGAPPTLEVTGASAGPLSFPTPEKLTEGPFTSYAYTGEVLLPFAIDAHEAGPLSIAAHATWLVCEKICVPEETILHLDLPSGTGAKGSEAALFAATDAHTPRPSPFPAHVAPDGTLWLAGMTLPVKQAYFFADIPGVIDHGAPQIARSGHGPFSLALKPVKALDPAASLAGVLTLVDAGGEASALRIEATPQALPAGAGPAAGVAAAAATGLLEALALAFAGGLILNLMPCVLPVLAMKAVALSRLSGAARGHVRREAAFYVLGVVLAFSAIGAATLGVREAGGEAGWGVQFQSLAFTTAMAWLLFGIGLNMSGVFEVGAGLAGTGQGLASRGSFFTGLLAVVVATPCTAPFMGAALAAALALPAWSGMLIFLALGLGLAAPYALLALVPRLAALLPRPGAWMDVLRKLLAVPMYGAALWMLWVASLQGGLAAAASGLVLLGFAGWALGRSQRDEARRSWRAASFAAFAASLAVLGFVALAPAPAPALAASAVPANDGSEPFSAARLAELREQHRPVLVDMSAAWCITCLVNERLALAPQAVRDAFARRHVAYLKGDWTRQDPAITAFLRQYDRSGVPLYVFYPAEGEPLVLPQILSEGGVLALLQPAGS